LCIKLVITQNCIKMHSQQNIKVLPRVTGLKTVLCINLRRALELTEEHVIKWRMHSAVTSNMFGYFTLYHYFRM
jgi:hypothetical protein